MAVSQCVVNAEDYRRHWQVETFLVKFVNVYGKSWEERIARPVNAAAILAAIKRKVGGNLAIREQHDSDYAGQIFAGGVETGRYLIIPGSSRLELRRS